MLVRGLFQDTIHSSLGIFGVKCNFLQRKQPNVPQENALTYILDDRASFCHILIA